jgi:glycosyltransferase involved in cell wall biosynthesis
LIHANSIRAGLAAVLAARLGAPPVIVHLRDCLPSGRLANLIRRFLTAGAKCLIANSDYTATNFAGGNSRDNVVTVHNPVDLDVFSPGRHARDEARDRLGLERSAPVLGVIGQLAPWKGHDDAIRCFATLRARWPNACLLLVGNAVFTSRATRFDNCAYGESLHRLARSLNLNGSVRFLGEREDLPAILRAVDLVLLPSWEEPFGRTVVEAMAMEVPVVATSVGGPAEVITDGVDGVLLPPRQPDAWASVVDDLLSRPSYRAELGQRARCAVVRRFGINDHARKILEIYREVLAGRG